MLGRESEGDGLPTPRSGDVNGCKVLSGSSGALGSNGEQGIHGESRDIG